MSREVVFFFVMVACGVCVSVLFDFVRAFRITVKPPAAAVAVSDVLFCFAAMFVSIACVWNLNSGIFRMYEPVGMILGAVMYFLTVGRWVLRIFIRIFENILKIGEFILKILLTPLSFLYKILVVPIRNKLRKGRNTDDERIQGQSD